MVRTLANSLVLAIGIALALSLLPSIELNAGSDVSVFRRDNQVMLTEETLVDFLLLQQPGFTYRHVEWDESAQLLQIDFTTDTEPTETLIVQEWLRFIQEVNQSTNNIEQIVCRLFSNDRHSLLAVLKVETANLSHPKDELLSNAEQAASYLKSNFFFEVY